MKIYIPYWVQEPHHADNPYVATLTDGIRSLSQDIKFYFGDRLFWSDECESMDVIHIMWPNIFSDAMGQGSDLLQRVLYLKSKGVKIIATCHNLIPHTPNELWQKAYDIIYNNCDVMIHLGNYSLRICQSRYPEAKHAMIPHHIYDKLYKETVDKGEALKKMYLSEKYKYILCMGAFRNKDERNLVKFIAKAFKHNSVKIIAPSFILLPNGKCRLWRRSGWKWLLIKMLHSNIIVKGKYVDHDEIPFYYAASDIAFIHRYSILNSGNLPLAFMFGKVVVGPAVGNVGEILDETKNPIFIPNERDSMIQAVAKGLAECKNNQIYRGGENKKFAFKFWNTNKISEAHLDLYRNIMQPCHLL